MKNIAKEDAPQQIEETTKILEVVGCKMIRPLYIDGRI